MRETITTTRRRVAVAAAGIAAVAAIAVPGIAWANGSIPETAPAVVATPTDSTPTDSTPGLEIVPATECAPALTPEEVEALVAKGELSLEESVPATLTEASVIAPGADEGDTAASIDAEDSSVTLAVSC